MDGDTGRERRTAENRDEGNRSRKNKGVLNVMKKHLWELILPITFQQFMLALVGASDALMLGKLNQDALSAVSLASQVAFVFNLFMTALVIGTSMFAAQYWGKQDRESIREVLSFVIRTTLAVGLLFCLGAVLVPDALMRIFTNDAKLIGLGAGYLKVVGVSYLLSGISQIYLCILKNTGHAGKSMLISSATVVWNLALNAVLIFGFCGAPAMGIAGAALATVLANAAGLVWAVLESFREDGLRLAGVSVWLRVSKLERRFWRYTAPVMANELIWGGGFTMYSVIMGHLGTDAVAANSIANIMKNLVVCFCIGMGNAGSIVVGNALGAGELGKAKEEGAYLCRLSVIGGILTGALLLALSPLILSFADISVQAREYLKFMLLVSSYYLVGKSVNSMTIGGIFCAGGDSRFGLCCDAVTLWCVTIPAGMIAAFVCKAPVPVVYFLLNLDEIVKLPAVYRHYKKYRWVRNLTEEGERARTTAPTGPARAETGMCEP